MDFFAHCLDVQRSLPFERMGFATRSARVLENQHVTLTVVGSFVLVRFHLLDEIAQTTRPKTEWAKKETQDGCCCCSQREQDLKCLDIFSGQSAVYKQWSLGPKRQLPSTSMNINITQKQKVSLDKKEK